jgi:hypothetical protein
MKGTTMSESQTPMSVPMSLFSKAGPLKDEQSVFKNGTGYIVSVHFNPVRFVSNYVNLDVTVAGVSGKEREDGIVAICEIPDAVEIVRIGDVEAPKVHRGLDLANAFVNDLFQSIAGVNLSVGIHPGIAVSNTKQPGYKFISELVASEERYCNNLINEGIRLHAQNQLMRISEDHHKAAEYMGVDAVYSKKVYSIAGDKKCIACAEVIKAEAVICRFCQVPQDAAALKRLLAARYDALGGGGGGGSTEAVVPPAQPPAQPTSKSGKS